MRKLASIQKIIALEPIENADAIEKATVLGWQLVVKKGDFNRGEESEEWKEALDAAIEAEYPTIDEAEFKQVWADKPDFTYKAYLSQQRAMKTIATFGAEWAKQFLSTPESREESEKYWRTRCELAETFIRESPCDPDITSEQMKAWKEYTDFITRNP